MSKKSDLVYPMRLQRYLAKCGLGSRRFCETLIQNGSIRLNGVTVATQGVKVLEDDLVEYNNTPVSPVDPVYIALNKPIGYVSSNFDPHHTLLARDLIDIRERASLFHVGRLDKDSSGLILYTNDGNFAQRISHPSNEIEKEYVVTVREYLKKDDLAAVKRNGIVIDTVRYRIKDFSIHTSRTVHIILQEGKNREIRKIFSSLGYTISGLHRIRIGDILLGNLESGSFRYLTDEEVESIKGVAGG